MERKKNKKIQTVFSPDAGDCGAVIIIRLLNIEFTGSSARNDAFYTPPIDFMRAVFFIYYHFFFFFFLLIVTVMRVQKKTRRLVFI